jgi:fatty-acyl-CoA synthase
VPSERRQTLACRIDQAAGGHGAVTFVVGNQADRVPFARLHDEAIDIAASLQRRGVRPGSHVALLGPTTRALYTTIEAVWLSGATLVVLPLPMRLGSIEEFAAQTRAKMTHADVDLVVVDPDLAPFIEAQPGDPPMVLSSDLIDDVRRLHIGAADFDRPDEDPDRLAVLQFTSGSTADPKGVMLPNHTICANLDAIEIATELDVDRDVMVSWLPLYHDMGLVGFAMLPMSTGVDVVIGAPQDFLAAPLRWLEWLSTFGGTATAGPNFSWVLATRALRNASGLDLSPLRLALNGAEPVDPDAVEEFVDAAVPHKMRPGAVFPAFGMAEVVIGATFPAPLSGLRPDAVDRRVLETERYAAPVDDPSATSSGIRRLARLGRPLPGLEIRIVDPEDGSVRAEREVGELEIRGSSVTPGYYGRPDLARELFHDGYLRTGDLAYLVDGELVVCGRMKDVIIVGGRNVYPEDVERAVAAIDGVRAGNVIAFGVPGRGKEGVVVVAETRSEDPAATRRSVAERVRQAVGLPPKDIVLVEPGTLPKTSSGKLQRGLCRQRYLGEELVAV